jgi:periplasmic protein TonB
MARVLTIPGARWEMGRFPRMVVFSLLMHAIFSIVLLSGYSGRTGTPVVQYIDLDMMEQAVTPPAMSQTQEAPTPVEEPSIPVAQPEAAAEKATVAQEPVQQESLPPASFGFGIVNGRFGSLSDGRTLRDDMREYYLGMLDRFNESWAKNTDANGIRGAAFIVTISRSGEIIDTQLLESSGNRSYDRLMLQSLRNSGPLSPLPESYEADFFSAPLRFVGPLNLMSPFSG